MTGNKQNSDEAHIELSLSSLSMNGHDEGSKGMRGNEGSNFESVDTGYDNDGSSYHYG